MTLTKITGGVCGALLVFLLGNWVAESLYTTGGGHGDDHGQAYVIDTGSDDQSAEVEDGPSLAEMMAAADVGKGEKAFKKCAACHAVDDSTVKVGPPLKGVVGRAIGGFNGFGYSGALNAVGETWTPETLNAFLESPKKTAPGTSMSFSGMSKPADRANVIMYLDQLDGDIYELAAPVEEAAAEDVVEEAVEEVAETAEEAVEEVTEAAQEAVEEVAEAAEEAAEDVAAAVEEEATLPSMGVDLSDTGAEEAATAVEEATEEVAEAANAAAGSEFAALVAAADIDAGQKTFNRCKACHQAKDGGRGVGPHLYDVVGRPIATVEKYKYSDALKALGGEWTVDRLNEWIENPKAYAPGNKMRFKGLSDIQDRANVVAYLQSVVN